jgi:hypothetical protein
VFQLPIEARERIGVKLGNNCRISAIDGTEDKHLALIRRKRFYLDKVLDNK